MRLIDVYAAELNEPGGPEAKARMELLVKGKDVALVRQGHDRYGRTLAHAYVDGRAIRQSDIGPRAGRGSQRVH